MSNFLSPQEVLKQSKTFITRIAVESQFEDGRDLMVCFYSSKEKGCRAVVKRVPTLIETPNCPSKEPEAYRTTATIPDSARVVEATTSYEDGVLTITVPLSEKSEIKEEKETESV